MLEYTEEQKASFKAHWATNAPFVNIIPPFTMAGFMVWDLETPPPLRLDFRGSGTVTAHYDVGRTSSGTFYTLRTMRFDFGRSNTTPTPEPSALLLLGSGLALIVRKVRAQRSL